MCYPTCPWYIWHLYMYSTSIQYMFIWMVIHGQQICTVLTEVFWNHIVAILAPWLKNDSKDLAGNRSKLDKKRVVECMVTWRLNSADSARSARLARPDSLFWGDRWCWGGASWRKLDRYLTWIFADRCHDMSCRSEVGWKYGEVFAALRPLHVPICLGQTRCLQGVRLKRKKGFVWDMNQFLRSVHKPECWPDSLMKKL